MTIPDRYVQARWYTRGGMVEPRAILWHMAEGYGTVGYFTHVARDVSAHYVIERSGAIVQMVRLEDASHSAHVALDANDTDAPDCGIYSGAVGRMVLGSGWADINAYVVAVEVEGFRADGPSVVQSASIDELYFTLRAQLPRLRGNLGHRDVQDYKGCPGCRFPWARIGGHGLIGAQDTEGSNMAVQAALGTESRYVIDLPAGTSFYEDTQLAHKYGRTTNAGTVPYLGPGIGADSRAVVILTGIPYGDKQARPTIVMVQASAGRPYAKAEPSTCADEIAADRERAYVAYR